MEACTSLRTSGESVGADRVNTITMTCWSRDRGSLMTYRDNARTAPRMSTSQSDLYVCESPNTHQQDVVFCDKKSSKSPFFKYVSLTMLIKRL